jgi:hypothetical protein|tara:strand:+ start:5051 stop:5254 length:204 start_codon:yes stop_codon:yes gene_type:complete
MSKKTQSEKRNFYLEGLEANGTLNDRVVVSNWVLADILLELRELNARLKRPKEANSSTSKKKRLDIQ